jgi:hypothetical protein
MSTVTPQAQILGIVNNHWQSCCVGAAAQLELADLLADGPLHVDILAERTKTHAPSLYRMLRALERLMLSLKNERPRFEQVTGQNGWEHMQSNPETYTRPWLPRSIGAATL